MDTTRLAADEIIDEMFDSGSFSEMYAEMGIQPNVRVGQGMVDGRGVYVLIDEPCPKLQDLFLPFQKKATFLREVRRNPMPVVLFLDALALYSSKSAGFSVPKGIKRLFSGKDGIGWYFSELAKLSGMVPLISVIRGNFAGAAVLGVTLADTTVFIQGSLLSLTRANDANRLLGSHVSPEDLGGAEMHCRSGLGDKLVDDETHAINWIKQYLSYFPNHYRLKPPIESRYLENDELPRLKRQLPFETNTRFEMRVVLSNFGDKNSFLELKEMFAEEAVTGLARVKGRPVGLIGNNSSYKFGALYPDTCKKIGKFIMLCDAHSIPIVFFADTPGFMVGEEVEKAGLIKAGSSVLSLLAHATIPKVFVNLRKAFGGGIYVMAGPGLGDKFIALPGCSFGPLEENSVREPESAEEADGIRELLDMKDMEKLLEEGFVDDIVSWKNLRTYVAEYLIRESEFCEPSPFPRRILPI